jgi:predicted ATPase
MEYESVRLLVARAAAAGRRVPLDESNAADFARIVERLDGLPLAIELTAGKLRSLSLAELAGMLDKHLALLGEGDRTAPPRHRTLEAAIAWSFQLLTGEERSVLLRLAAFPASFDRACACAIDSALVATNSRWLSATARSQTRRTVSAVISRSSTSARS